VTKEKSFITLTPDLFYRCQLRQRPATATATQRSTNTASTTATQRSTNTASTTATQRSTNTASTAAAAGAPTHFYSSDRRRRTAVADSDAISAAEAAAGGRTDDLHAAAGWQPRQGCSAASADPTTATTRSPTAKAQTGSCAGPNVVKLFTAVMEKHALKNVNKCLNTNIYSYLETSGGRSSNPY